MTNNKALVSFQGISPGQANQLARELEEHLLTHATSAVSIEKERTDTQDFGATLAIILAGPAVVAVAKGIADWIRKRSEVKVTIRIGDKEIVGENLTSGDIQKFLEQVK